MTVPDVLCDLVIAVSVTMFMVLHQWSLGKSAAGHGVDHRSTPDVNDRQLVDTIIFDELTRHEFTDSSKQHYLRIMRQLEADGADGVVLGCTEIGLLVEQNDLPQHPFLDTTVIHVERVVQLALEHATLPDVCARS